MEEKEESNSILSYLKKVGIAREKGGAFFEESLRLAGTVKGVSMKIANMLNKAFKAKDTNVLTFKRTQLPELFGMVALEPPRAGKPPTIKNSVREHLRARGIKYVYSRNAGLIDFIKTPPKQYR